MHSAPCVSYCLHFLLFHDLNPFSFSSVSGGIVNEWVGSADICLRCPRKRCGAVLIHAGRC